ncbi:MAG: TonB family protein [Devosia sp.]
MRNALPASILVHVALLGGAWLALNWSPAPEETGVESVSVDIVSLKEFTSTATSTARSSATETLVAAGAKALEPVETTEAAEPVETAVAEPAEPAEPEAEATDPVETASVQAAPTEPVEVEETVSAEVLMAALTETAVPVEGLAPGSVSAIATQVTPTAPEVLEPIEDPAPVAPRPLPRPKFETKVAEAKPEPKRPEPKKAEPEKPTKKKPVAEQPKKTKPVQAGNGGKSNADVAASAPSGGKGASDAAGNAAVSKYPGQVQRALRRALRFPKGAGSARGEVQVTFVVSSSGAASQIAVSQSSGHAVLDKEAIATVKRAAPFPPIPEAAGRNSWTFTMPLAFTR